MADLSDRQSEQSEQSENTTSTIKGVVGIQNMGNTCYCNTTLQVLRTCPEWNAYCLSQDFTNKLANLPEGNTYKRILLAYQDILKSLWSASRPAYVRPLGFISEVRKAVRGTVYEMFGAPIANDSHEYLVYLLDNFHEALKQEGSWTDMPVPQENSVERMRILAENGWNRFYHKNSSYIVDLFFGMMRKTVECTNCQNNTYQWEVFNVLKIPCEGQTFQEWIQNEVKDSEIEGYHCEKCNGKHHAKIYSHIWKLPQSLYITLRRFNHDGRKNMMVCPYRGENIQSTQFFAKESIDPSRDWIYELRGVSDHHGSHLGGHYTAQFRHPISGEWWQIDDDNSYPLQSPQFSQSNYIYFLRRSS